MYCQKCRAPLKADGSLETLNPAAFDLLIGSANRSSRKSTGPDASTYPPERKTLYDKTLEGSPFPLFKRNVPGPITGDNVKVDDDIQAWSGKPDMSFVEITESQIVPPSNTRTSTKSQSIDSDERRLRVKAHESALSARLDQHDKLYSILSSHSEIDHPICCECSTMLVTAFSTRLASVAKERDAYASFLKSLQQNHVRKVDFRIQNELDSLLRDEEQALKELQELEADKKILEIEIATLEEEDRQLDLQEVKFWRSRNAFDNRLHDLEVDLTSLQQKHAHDQQQLERLQRTNVYNDTFCIGHDGYFGTINDLRLGRLPNQNVEWAEINAAWGQTLLLLATVAERLSFNFKGYRLRPLGSTSRIEKLEWPQQPPEIGRNLGTKRASTTSPPPRVTQMDLFSSGDMPLGRVFNHRRFDDGMVAFLECLSQLGIFVEKTSKEPSSRTGTTFGTAKPGSLVLPYSIDGDKIGGVSIRLGVGFSQDENFTKACKYALTCCKFLLAHVSNLESTRFS